MKHRLFASTIVISTACGPGAPPSAAPAAPAPTPITPAPPAASTPGCGTPVDCFRQADDRAQAYNRALNNPDGAMVEDAEVQRMQDEIKQSLNQACDGGHACACLVLKTGDCNDPAACSEMSGEQCLVKCSDELGCATEAFFFLGG